MTTMTQMKEAKVDPDYVLPELDQAGIRDRGFFQGKPRNFLR